MGVGAWGPPENLAEQIAAAEDYRLIQSQVFGSFYKVFSVQFMLHYNLKGEA